MILDTVNEFCEESESAQRAIFDSAMIKRLSNEGYRISDLIYEVYCCQKAIKELQRDIEALQKPKRK